MNEQNSELNGATGLCRGWPVVLLVLPVLYVLSVGPTIKYCEADRHGTVLFSAYTPLWILMADFKPFGRFVMWYAYQVWRSPWVSL